jgi:hypothetical protein
MWASGSRKPGKLDFHLQAHYDKLMIELHTEQVQNASAKFDNGASSFMKKCDGLLSLLRKAYHELNQHQLDY